MMKLWGTRFSQSQSELLELFNASIDFDKTLYKQDIKGSKAHAKGLFKIGILTKEELDSITAGLERVQKEIEEGKFVFKLSHEDIHMSIETRLTELIGEVGKKLHTARSRNDQVALDFSLYCNEENAYLQNLILELITTLTNLASLHTTTLMPGMTHLQHAQPISFGFHLMAWVASLKKDYLRFKSAKERNDECPLGSAALAGSVYGNDRDFVAKELGYTRASMNAMESVSSRDFALDLSYAIATLMMHISRMAEELILWSSYEFKFVSFSDEYSTGSSIMPQKKNPDVAELLRGKSGRTFGNLMALLTVLKGLPLAYNKDMQEDKEGVFDSVATAKISLLILKASLETLSIHKENMLAMCQKGHLNATDLADFLVKEHAIAFRDAHHIVGRCVLKAESLGLDLSQIDLHELKDLLPKDVDFKVLKKTLDLNSCMERRDTLGGTASSQTLSQIEEIKQWLKQTLNS
ncbi:argininosuccinate lyase [Helicobacter sp. 11S02629-2]|uniref:argininosuccinate lyase n=1 Tax=Helicobacter sp. 11S02629-2 TaxID=1476195 RepID=UPI000BA6550E|nr:argininosuccinate lyase [Helicobacter sp. 11S02629-2]PAF45495.1 argininosuccinate lyase [Helicobacter sp. 11S02629-2]